MSVSAPLKIARDDIDVLERQREELVIIANDLDAVGDRLRAWTSRMAHQLRAAVPASIAREADTSPDLEIVPDGVPKPRC